MIRALRRGAAAARRRKSGARSPGRSRLRRRGRTGAAPPKPWRRGPAARSRCIHATTAGSVRSGASTVTSSSPETPVAVLELVDVLERRQVAGDELADVGDHLIRVPRPSRRPRAPAGDAAPARARRSRRRAPAAARMRRRPATAEAAVRLDRADARARGRPCAAVGRRPRERPAPLLAGPRLGQRAGERRQPGGERERERDRDPEHEQQARSRGPSGSARATRTQEAGRGRERRGARSPARRWPPPRPPPAAARSPPRRPRRSGPGTGSRSRPRGRSAPAGRRSTPSSASRRPATGSRR